MKQQEKAAAGEDARRRILLVDDHPLVRQGIRMLVDREEDLGICGEADSASEALRVLETARPDLAIVDLSLKGSNGLELIKDIQIRFPKVLVLVLSMRDEAFYAERVLRAGARGYITKEEGTRVILEGIRKVLSGQIFLSERMASRMIGKFIRADEPQAGSPLEGLTDREMQVFELIGQGLPTREIAAKLHLSPKTVESHRENIKGKLKLDSAAELLRHAIEWVQSVRGA